MCEIFKEKDVQYNLRRLNTLSVPKARTTTFCIENVTYLGHKLWSTLSQTLRVPILGNFQERNKKDQYTM